MMPTGQLGTSFPNFEQFFGFGGSQDPYEIPGFRNPWATPQRDLQRRQQARSSGSGYQLPDFPREMGGDPSSFFNYDSSMLQSGRGSGYGGSFQQEGASRAPQGSQGRGLSVPGMDWDFSLMLPPDGVYGQQKWMPGNAIDVFTRRGTVIRAPTDGIIGPLANAPPGPMGPIAGFVFSDASGKSARFIHVQPMGQPRRVRRGEPIGTVMDPSMDMLGAYPGMPDGFQHIDLALASSPGALSYADPGRGGDVNASQFLRGMGYGRQIPGSTRGPNSGGMGGMMGNPFGGGSPFGGGMPGMGGMPPMMGGMGGPGMGGMPPFPMGGMGGMGGPGMGGMPPPFMMGGMPPFMMGGMPPFMGGMGGGPGGFFPPFMGMR